MNAIPFNRREPGVPEVEPLDLSPHSVEAEQSTLGALLLDSRTWPLVRDLLAEADFYRADHRAIWRAFERVQHEDGRADPLTVAEQLRADGELDAVGGVAYLSGLTAATPSAANVTRYARIVRDRARQRELAGQLEALRLATLEPGADLAELRAQGEKALAAVPYGDGVRAQGWPQPIDLAQLAQAEPQPPALIMEGVPLGYATGTWGPPGVGKSQIELLRATCIASGVPFCGLEVKRRRVLYLSCEDRQNILHWRLARICRHLQIDMAELCGWLDLLDLVGRDSILYAPNPRTGDPFTPAFHTLAKRVRDNGAEVIVADGITDTFGGNENSRSEVKQYVNGLVGLVPEDRGAVMLLGHVNKSTENGGIGEGYSGSTGWNGSVRARWYLRPETRKGDDGERNERTGALLLELQKANHGGAVTLRFEWDQAAHLFAGSVVGGLTRFDQVHREREEERGILAAFKALADADVAVPSATMGQRTALNVLAACPEFPASLTSGKAGKRRFWRLVEQLRQQRAIQEGSYRRTNRHVIATLALTAEGVRRCAE